MHCLIVTGGHTDLPFAKEYIASQQFDYVVAADAGLVACKALELLPDLILGDFDSVEPAVFAFYQARCPERMERFPAEKDETDTELALLRAISAGAKHVTILGGTGTRLDHVLGNIHLLKLALDAGVDCKMVDANNRIRMIDGVCVLEKQARFGKYVSLLPFTPVVSGLTLEGFAYAVEDYDLCWGKARGVSNQLAAEEGRISFKEGVLLVIESRD